MAKKPVMMGNESATEMNVVTTDSDLNTWLEKGIKLPLEDLAAHVRSIPNGVKPLKALRGLGIVFAGSHTKDFDCKGYPQKAGLPKDRQRLDIVLERVLSHEANGETIKKVRGMILSEVLKSNFANN